MKRIQLALVLSLLQLHAFANEDSGGVLTPAIGAAIRDALDEMNMTESDMGFDRDQGEPRSVMPVCRNALRSHASLAGTADDAIRAARNPDRTAVWRQAGAWLGAPDLAGGAQKQAGLANADALPPGVREAVQCFLDKAVEINGFVQESCGSLGDEEKQGMVASYLAGILNVEEDPGAFRSLVDAGVSSQEVARAVLAGQALDGRASSGVYLDRLERMDAGMLCKAGGGLAEALRCLASAVATIKEWPASPLKIGTPLGALIVGSPSDDVYREPACLILDPGGDDSYRGCAGTANGLLGRPVGAILDLQGDDEYRSGELCGAGTAILGVCAVLDCAGDDSYRAAFMGQAAAVFGSAWMEDDSGADQYSARFMSQAAAVGGVAVFRDRAGSDTYQAGMYAQGFASTRAVGWFIEETGHDRYYVGGIEPDYERHKHRFISFGQGTSLGMRPAAGGGVGVLNDLDGNDLYISDVYGQGVSYWYSIGMLLDSAGHDSYQVYEYGQGVGIHLSAGLLYDRNGNDMYTGFSLAQGSAHDFAVGLLLDVAGDDTYTADHFSQGRAINNSLALLVDRSGKDAYFARENSECQAMGQWSTDRSMGSLSLLADLGGEDQYSSGAPNCAVTTKPDSGAILDRAEAQSDGKAVPARDGSEGEIRWRGAVLAATNATLDQLMFHASRYACTEERRINKEAALAELKRRGPEALRYLVSGADSDSILFSVYALQLLGEMDAESSSAALLDLAGAPSKEVRRMAVFLLGFCKTPHLAPNLRPLLDDPEACGAAVRTLGAWKDAGSVTRISRFLSDPKERRRAQAATALGEIGALDAIPGLTSALGDPSGLVRNAAARALAGFDPEAVGPRLLDSLGRSTPEIQRRQVVRMLGALRWRAAARPLRDLLAKNPSEALRRDVERALEQISRPGPQGRDKGQGSVR